MSNEFSLSVRHAFGDDFLERNRDEEGEKGRRANEVEVEVLRHAKG